MSDFSPNMKPGLAGGGAGIGPEDYEQHAQWLRRLARGLVNDPAAAEDVVQETWLSALRFWKGRDRPLRPWLARTAQNAAKKSKRSEVRRRQREALASDVEIPVLTPAELTESADLAHALMGQVRELSEPYRSTVLQRYMQGLSSAEIARRAGVPEGTVRWRLATARDELRERMDRRVGSRALWVGLADPIGRVATDGAAGSGAGASASAKGLGAKGAAAKGAKIAGSGFPWGVVLPIVAAVGVLACVGKVTYWLYENRHQKAARAPVEADADELALVEPLGLSPEGRGREAIAAAEALESGEGPQAPGAAPASRMWDLDPGESIIRVRVLDESSEPLANASMRWPDDRDAFAQSDEEGVAALLFRPPADGAPQDFVIERRGYASAVIRGAPFAGSVTDLGSVLLLRASRRTGRVVGADGKPVEGARVGAVPVRAEDAFTGALGDGSGRRRQAEIPDPWPGVSIPTALTGADGSFVLEGAPLRKMRLWATAEGQMCTFSNSIEPGTAEALKPVNLALIPLPESLAIAGTVKVPGGASAEGTLVRLVSLDGRRVIAEVEPTERGKFRFMVRDQGDYVLRTVDLLDRWSDADEVEVTTGQKRAVVTLKKK